MALQHLRSNTASKRPTPGSMSDGQLAINTNATSPGLFFKDAGGALIKVGPVHVGTSAPNSVPAGSSGNAIGEQWLDTSGGGYVFKIWDGTAWRSETGQFVDVAGDTMTGNLTISGADLIMSNGEIVAETGSAATPSITFTGDTNTGIYSPGADQVAISTGGTGRLFVDNSGLVGIGASSSGAKLDVDGSGDFNDNITIKRSSSAPGLIFNNSSYAGGNASISYFNTGSLLFSTNNSERLRITSAGSVGIGTSSPAALLHLSSSANTTLRLTDTAGSYSDIIYNESGSVSQLILDADPTGSSVATGGTSILLKTDGSTAMTIDSSQRVGIGTTSPGELLQISGTNDTAFGLKLASGTQAATVKLDASGNIDINNNLARALILSTSNTERARIDSSGRLLVGTSSSLVTKNNVGTSTETFFNLAASGGSTAGAVYRTARSNNSIYSSIILDKQRGDIGTPSVVIADDYLGAVTFTGYDGAAQQPGAAIAAAVDGTPSAGDMPGRLVFSTTADGASSPTERMRITNGGNVCLSSSNGSVASHSSLLRVVQIGNAASVDAALNIGGGFTGDASLNIRDLSGTAASFYFGSTKVGSITLTASATAYNTSSDYRLKENILPVTDGITRLQQLKPSRFNFIADPDTTVDGFLAHEVQTVVPEAITGEKDAVDDEGNPQYQGIDQSKIVPLLTAALQEAIGEIESLKARVAALESA